MTVALRRVEGVGWSFRGHDGVSSATFSRCGEYRYDLRRVWKPGKRVMVFVGLNPSTADQHTDDPTIRRILGFADDWGFGTLVMLNAFAYRSTDPKGLAAYLAASTRPKRYTVTALRAVSVAKSTALA